MKKKVGTPTPKTAPGARKTAPKRTKKVLSLKLGGCYINKSGEVRGPMEPTPDLHYYAKTNPFRCKMTGETFAINGRWVPSQATKLDLIREVPSAKRPGARRAKGGQP